MTSTLAISGSLFISMLGPVQQWRGPLTTDGARQVFAEAAQISESDAGRLWGITLYGPMIVVEADSRRAIANGAVDSFQREDDLFVGSLPETIAIANTAFEWQETRWTMLRWPLPEDEEARRRLIAHEMWHRIQTELGLPASGAGNLHLGTRDGRVWMQLEWRALAAALRSEGEDRLDATADALAFREKRHRIFPNAGDDERSLIVHEGLAEYTGVILGSESHGASRKVAIRALGAAPGAPSFVRSFAYTSG
ncbi:MAG: hypothetical protein HKO76_04760, partial [Acidimicrobiia bacterium]|nr:hypothetical protein [Acidimicrobiia bacterium]